MPVMFINDQYPNLLDKEKFKQIKNRLLVRTREG